MILEHDVNPKFCLNHPSRRLHYLPHLDGLRLLSLLGVLLFHFDSARATGGFIGVDCFLVLSGFLITRNIQRSIKNASFTFRAFYLRRFYRLYPASFGVTFITFLLAILIFPPDLSSPVTTSALASSFFVSNIHFSRISDYFDHAAHFKPLLHTWSLSLEEQYYLCWPILLWFATSKCSNPRWVLCSLILLVSALSVALNYALHVNYPSFVFYMLPTRIFEFAVGTLCALTETQWRTTNPSLTRRLAETAVSILSVMIIITSFFYMPIHAEPHHVLFVLTAATGFIISPNSILCRYVFGNRIVYFLGSLTYSAYLTHWPIYVFSKYLWDALGTPRPGVVVLTIASFASAFLIQACIEQPLRKKRTKYLTHCIAFFVTFLILCVGTLIAQRNGYTINPYLLNEFDVLEDCEAYSVNWSAGSYGCETGDLKGRHANVSVVGDSYTSMLIPAFNALGKKKGLKFSFLYLHGCPLLPLNYPDQGLPGCSGFETKRWETLSGVPVNGVRVIPENGTVLVAQRDQSGGQDIINEKVRGVFNGLRDLGYRMVLVTPAPGMDESELWRHACNDLRKSGFMRLLSLMGLSSGMKMCVGGEMKPYMPSYRTKLGYKKALEDEDLAGIELIDLFHEMCEEIDGNLKCQTPWDFQKWKGFPKVGYLRDGHHMKRSGSIYISQIFEKFLYH